MIVTNQLNEGESPNTKHSMFCSFYRMRGNKSWQRMCGWRR